MNIPKVSVIVPIYNVEEYLDRCMTSILNQTLKDIEIIMVDDGSPDNCPAMCDEYAKKDPRIKVIHKANGGLGYARNSGLEIATGEYVAFVDSDDFVDIHMYETLYNKAQEHALDTCYSGFYRYVDNEHMKNIYEALKEGVYTKKSEIDYILFGMMNETPHKSIGMSVWKAIYSREIIQSNNIAFVSEREIVSEDLIFHIDYLTKAKRIGYIKSPMYYYFVNQSSLTSSYSERKYNAIINMMYELENRLKQHYTYDEYIIPQCYNILRLFKAVLRFEVGNNKRSFRENKQSLKEKISHPIYKELFVYEQFYSKLSLYNKILYTLLKCKSSIGLYILQHIVVRAKEYRFKKSLKRKSTN